MAAGYQAVTSDVHRIKHQTVPPHREITTTHLNDDATVKQATLDSLRLVYLGGAKWGYCLREVLEVKESPPTLTPIVVVHQACIVLGETSISMHARSRATS